MKTRIRAARRWLRLRVKHAWWTWNGRPIERWLSVKAEVVLTNGEVVQESWRYTARRAEALVGTTPIQDVDDLFGARCARAFEDGISRGDAAVSPHAIREVRVRSAHQGNWRLPDEYLVLEDAGLVKVDLR